MNPNEYKKLMQHYHNKLETVYTRCSEIEELLDDDRIPSHELETRMRTLDRLTEKADRIEHMVCELREENPQLAWAESIVFQGERDPELGRYALNRAKRILKKA